MQRAERETRQKIEEWLDDRYAILNFENPPRQADASYYEGALKAVEFFGYEWRRTDGKHILYKCK